MRRLSAEEGMAMIYIVLLVVIVAMVIPLIAVALPFFLYVVPFIVTCVVICAIADWFQHRTGNGMLR